jgi:hypothetical protein
MKNEKNWKKGANGAKSGKASPYSKPALRRRPEDAEAEDRVLLHLVDSKTPWGFGADEIRLI